MAAKKKIAQEAGEVITTFKGFDSNLQCRGFQYEVGGEYTHDGGVAACSSGFHACEYPLDVLGYYAPAGSRFCIVEQSGQLSRHADDSKVASSKIKVTAEIGLPGIIKAAIEYTFKRSTPEGETATGDQGAASATGDQGAASATGDQGAASATGYQGAASATGNRGAAMASGYEGKVMGKEGNALFLVERGANYNIVAVWAGVAGRDGIKADTFYMLKGGRPVEVR